MISEDLQDISTVKKDDFVVVEYEGSMFPGKVLSKSKTGVIVSTLVPSNGNWKWPAKEDKLFYNFCDIKRILPHPQPINRRGVLKIPEMAEFW